MQQPLVLRWEQPLFVMCQDDQWIVFLLRQHSFTSICYSIESTYYNAWTQLWREKRLLVQWQALTLFLYKTSIITMIRCPENIFPKSWLLPCTLREMLNRVKALLVAVVNEDLSLVLVHAHCLRVFLLKNVNSKQSLCWKEILPEDHRKPEFEKDLVDWEGYRLQSLIKVRPNWKSFLRALHTWISVGTSFLNRWIICYLIMCTGTLSKVWMFKVYLDNGNGALCRACYRNFFIFSGFLLWMSPQKVRETVRGKIKRKKDPGRWLQEYPGYALILSWDTEYDLLWTGQRKQELSVLSLGVGWKDV